MNAPPCSHPQVGVLLGRKLPREGREPMIKDRKELLQELKVFVREQKEQQEAEARQKQQQQEVTTNAEAAALGHGPDTMDGATGEAFSSPAGAGPGSRAALGMKTTRQSRAAAGEDGKAAASTGKAAAALLPSERQLLQAGRGDMSSVSRGGEGRSKGRGPCFYAWHRRRGGYGDNIYVFCRRGGKMSLIPTLITRFADPHFHASCVSPLCPTQAIHRFGGFGRVSQLSGLQSQRRPRAYWGDIDNVVKEVRAFMLLEAEAVAAQAAASSPSHTPWPPSPERPHNLTEAAAVGAAADGDLSDLTSDPWSPLYVRKPGSGIGSSNDASSTGIKVGSIIPRRSGRGTEDPALSSADAMAAGAVAPSERLPTQKALLRAGRQDLCYGVQLHGHEAVARRAGLRVERRGLTKRKLG